MIDLKITNKTNSIYFNKQIGQTVKLDLRQYLYGVVASQIGNVSIQALKAQAVASRTIAYSYYSKNKQISDSGSSAQCFNAERLSDDYLLARKAVDQTDGEMVCYNGKPVSPCSFSSSNGGRTTSSQSRWGGKREWLIQFQDKWDDGNGKGHGVGMSQCGAINMAKAGKTYRQIIAFYYPGTQIKTFGGDDSMTDKQKIMITWAESKIGCGYIYGASGQKCSEAFRIQQAKQYPQYETTIMSTGAKWDGRLVYDCAQFTRRCAQQIGIKLVSGATSQWNKTNWANKGLIKDIPKDKVCFLYRQSSTNPSTMQHTGVYIGNQYFIHAKGTSAGVLKEKLSAYPWTHYAVLDYAESVKEEGTSMNEKMIVSTSGGTLNMRKTASKTSSVIAKIPNGKQLIVTQRVDDFYKIQYEGKIGYVMCQYLANKAPQSSSTQVTLTLTRETAEALIQALKRVL